MAVPLTGRFEAVWLLLVGSAYVYYLVLKLPKGVTRLLALTPLVPFYILVPWRGQTSSERWLMCFFFLWVSAFKIIMLAFDYGPAKDPWIMSSFPRFLTGMNFSMHINSDPLPKASSESQEQTADREEVSQNISLTSGKNGTGLHSRKCRPRGNETANAGEEKRKAILAKEESRGGESEGGGWMPGWLDSLTQSNDWRVVLLRCFLYLALFWLQRYINLAKLPTLILYFNFTVVMYFRILIVFELPAAIAGPIYKVELPAQFNMPFFATSIAEFWGRRWNLLINNLLRISIYNPIIEAFSRRTGKRSSYQVKALGVLASFTVSGIMHEILFLYMSKKRPSFEVTMFFVLNGVGTLLESWLKRKKYYNPSKFVGWLVAFCFVFLTAAWLFYPPLIRNGTAMQNREDLNRFVLWIQNLVFDSVMEVKSRFPSERVGSELSRYFSTATT
ncbi:hypothetical protein R1flu_002464 [Riccia fluitans]|uniref:Wax synthase domain-containing protein n=1 Tax=Riccia fluitans TaxID=41844 RepID=A0ABD1Y673_9MARC